MKPTPEFTRLEINTHLLEALLEGLLHVGVVTGVEKKSNAPVHQWLQQVTDEACHNTKKREQEKRRTGG